MPVWQQIVLYGRERGEAFLARARADAPVRFGGEPRIVERNVAFFAPSDCEPALAVYVEARFAAVVAAYQARGVSVVTDADLADPEPTHEAEKADQPPVAQDARQGDRPQEEVATSRRGRRRGA